MADFDAVASCSFAVYSRLVSGSEPSEAWREGAPDGSDATRADAIRLLAYGADLGDEAFAPDFKDVHHNDSPAKAGEGGWSRLQSLGKQSASIPAMISSTRKSLMTPCQAACLEYPSVALTALGRRQLGGYALATALFREATVLRPAVARLSCANAWVDSTIGTARPSVMLLTGYMRRDEEAVASAVAAICIAAQSCLAGRTEAGGHWPGGPLDPMWLGLQWRLPTQTDGPALAKTGSSAHAEAIARPQRPRAPTLRSFAAASVCQCSASAPAARAPCMPAPSRAGASKRLAAAPGPARARPAVSAASGAPPPLLAVVDLAACASAAQAPACGLWEALGPPAGFEGFEQGGPLVRAAARLSGKRGVLVIRHPEQGSARLLSALARGLTGDGGIQDRRSSEVLDLSRSVVLLVPAGAREMGADLDRSDATARVSGTLDSVPGGASRVEAAVLGSGGDSEGVISAVDSPGRSPPERLRDQQHDLGWHGSAQLARAIATDATALATPTGWDVAQAVCRDRSLSALRAWLGSHMCPVVAEPTEGDEADVITPDISASLRRGAQRLVSCVTDVVQLCKC